MGEKSDKSKYMEGNYSKNPFKAELEYRDDLIQAEQLQMQENYWKSYLNAAEKLRKEHHYLVDGAVLRCSKSTTNPIIITQSKGQLLKYEECTEDMLVGEAVVLEDPDNMECFRAPEGKSEVRLKVLQNTAAINGAGQYFATVKDTKKGGIGYYFDHDTDDYNIRFFGNCKNAPDRDDECKAIITAAESKELRNIGTCPYLMKLNDEWENFVSDVNYEEVTTLDGELSELITMEAVLFCKHGGFIYPVDSGYIPTETEEESELKKQLITIGQMIVEIDLKKNQKQTDSTLDPSDLESVKQYMWDFFRNAGFSEIEVAGILGNVSAESEFKPEKKRGSDYYGLFQWGGTRKDELIQRGVEYARQAGMENEEDGWKNVQIQCQFALDEYYEKTEKNEGWGENILSNSDRYIVGTKENFENAKDYETTALIWGLSFERAVSKKDKNDDGSYKQIQGQKDRLEAAQKIYDKFAVGE